MNREDHPVSSNFQLPEKAAEMPAIISAQRMESPISKVIDLINARKWDSKAEAAKSYEEFCNTLSRLHKEKTYVPPVCLT